MSIRRLADGDSSLVAAQVASTVVSGSIEVAPSTSATSERVRRLEDTGVIAGRRAAAAPDVLDRPVDAVVGVRGRSGDDRTALEAWFLEQDAIVDAVHLTGPHDDLLRPRCRTTAERDGVLIAVQHGGGVRDTETRIVLRSLPVDPPEIR